MAWCGMLILFCCVSCLTLTYAQQERGMRVVATDRELSIGNYYALIIAVNDYDDTRIDPLQNPLSDAQKLMDVLTRLYGFKSSNIVFLQNPTRSEIISTFRRLQNSVNGNDNLLVFYAGHGYWDKDIQQGYWLPRDASKDNPANWISNADIRDRIRGLKSKHTLLISDACFSGGIFKARSAFAESPPSIQEVHRLPSRKAMTSGILTEVPDESVFLRYLVKRMEENDKAYLTAEELFVSFKSAVINNSRNVPQFGVIQDAGDEGGDFVFVQAQRETEKISEIKNEESEKSIEKKKDDIVSPPTKEIVIEPELKLPSGFYLFYSFGLGTGSKQAKVLFEDGDREGQFWTVSGSVLLPALGYRFDERISVEARLFMNTGIKFYPVLIELKYAFSRAQWDVYIKPGLGADINNPNDIGFPVISAFIGVDHFLSQHFSAGLEAGYCRGESSKYTSQSLSANFLVRYHF